jgi:Ca-activated chloride channel family protein
VQVEFNPAQVAEYRLLGYENRLLSEADFNNDKVDAGEIGAGKTVTALYEITPVGKATLIDPHRYQNPPASKPTTHLGKELAFLRLRYKQPGKDNSILMQEPILASSAKASVNKASADFRFAASIAGFGMYLRDSNYLGSYSTDQLIGLAQSGLGSDEQGYRAEFVRLMQVAKELAPATATK